MGKQDKFLPNPRQPGDEKEFSNYLRRKKMHYKHTLCDNGSNRVLRPLDLPIGDCYPCESIGPLGKKEKFTLCNFTGVIFEPFNIKL